MEEPRKRRTGAPGFSGTYAVHDPIGSVGWDDLLEPLNVLPGQDGRARRTEDVATAYRRLHSAILIDALYRLGLSGKLLELGGGAIVI